MNQSSKIPAKEIPNIARKGKRFSHEMFDVKVWYDDSLDAPLFAISISLKVNKKAVVRNLIKRRLRVAISEIIKSTRPLKPGSYLIIVRSDKLKDLKTQEIQTQLEKVLNI
jgi:ribonuclease P protein component